MSEFVNEITVKLTAKEDVNVPVFKTAESAGADVCAYLKDDVVIPAGCRSVIQTGLFIELPKGYEMQVRPRSGLAMKNGITVLNTPGTIDSDYRGEIGVILINHGNESFTVHNGDRIAQLIVAPVVRFRFVETATLNETERGSGGFGSTGI